MRYEYIIENEVKYEVRTSELPIGSSMTIYRLLDTTIWHREDGPVFTYPSGEGKYYLFDIVFTEEEFWKRVYHD